MKRASVEDIELDVTRLVAPAHADAESHHDGDDRRQSRIRHIQPSVAGEPQITKPRGLMKSRQDGGRPAELSGSPSWSRLNR